MLTVQTPVRIDLTWFIEAYPKDAQRAYSAGHGKTGYISASLVEIDGEVMYWVTLDGTGEEIGSFGERDLDVS